MRCLAVLGLALAGCTADFFVGPEAQGGSSSGSVDPSTDPDTTGPDPSTTSASTASSTTAGTTAEPTTASTTTEPTTSGETADASTSSTTTGLESSTTEAPINCDVETAKACEAAFPECFWNGDFCADNGCNVGGELDCLAEAPDCIWEAGGCIPSGCADEAECSGLELAVCEKTPGCTIAAEQCFLLECVPCQEVEEPLACDELPNCAYNELRGACLPQ